MNSTALFLIGLLAIVALASAISIIQFSRRLKFAAQTLADERARHRSDLESLSSEHKQAIDFAQISIAAELKAAREHYENEMRRVSEAADHRMFEVENELNSLRCFSGLRDSEILAKERLETALIQSDTLRNEAETLMGEARKYAETKRQQALDEVQRIHAHNNVLLDDATKRAAQIVANAEKQAEGIAGDGYIALRDKKALEAAVIALWNVTSGYGDKYIVPTRSLLDELAEDFGHEEAGNALKAARDRTRRMVEQGLASESDYVEPDRRQRAMRFVVDAFNGRVESILSRVKNDNYGVLAQEIKDAFALVNLNGIAFRDTRVLPAYLDARLEELRWAVATQELRLKEREEQRRIKEQIREEEKARKEYEKAIQQAQRDEEMIRKAVEQARLKAETASAEQRASLEQQLAELNDKLAEAEARNVRAISMAQQTKKGNIYVVSNVGSFGEDVFKIGMTRRLDPMDRVRELSDASVPFGFDVHAIVPAEDAPALECALHEEFDDLRINKVNYRKEFFRLPMQRLRDALSRRGITASFTMTAAAHEYRESLAISKLSPAEREEIAQSRARTENDEE